MRAIINETMNGIFIDFKDEIVNKCLCELKTVRYDKLVNPDYTKKIVQQFYLLRYFPAYLCEYKYLYGKVLKTGIESLNILSIGCGCCVDYLAAYLACEKRIDKVEYCGIDPVDWICRNPLGNSKFHFVQCKIGQAKFHGETHFNVIFFPKSLSEIDKDDFNVFMGNISSSRFTSPSIFLVSSIMDKGFIVDAGQYNRIADVLRCQGYTCHGFMGHQEMKNKGALTYLDSEFEYPNDIKDFLNILSKQCKNFVKKGRNCEDECGSQLNRSPILTSKYMRYQFNHFKR